MNRSASKIGRQALFQVVLIFCFFKAMGQAGNSRELIPYRKGNLWGYANPDRQIIIPPRFEVANFFNHSWAIVKQDQKFGLINRKGEFIAEPKYDGLEPRGQGLIRFRENNRTGFIDTLGREKDLPAQEKDYKNYVTDKTGTRHEITSWISSYKIDGKDISHVSYKDSMGFPRNTLIDNNKKDLLPPEFEFQEAKGINGKIYFIIRDRILYEQAPSGELNFKKGQVVNYGVLNNQFKTIIPVKFHTIKAEHNFIAVKDKHNKIVFRHPETGKELMSQRFDYFRLTPQPDYYGRNKTSIRASVTSGKKQGLIDSTGRFIVPLSGEMKGYIPHSIEKLTESVYLVRKFPESKLNKPGDPFRFRSEDLLLGITDLKGKNLVIPYYTDYHLEQKEKLIILYNDSLISYFTFTGEKLADRYRTNPKQINAAELPQKVVAKDLAVENTRSCFYVKHKLPKGLNIVGNTCLYGVESVGIVNQSGKVVLPFQFNQIYPISENALAVRQGYKWGVVRNTGELILPIKFEKLVPLEGGNFMTGEPYYYAANTSVYHSQFSLRNKEGEVISAEKFLHEPYFNENPEWVTVKGGFVKIDRTGSILEKKPKIEFRPASQKPGYYQVRHTENWGFKDKSGQTIIPPRFFQVKPFQDGLAAVQKAGKWGYIDKTGKLIIPFQFQEASSFSEGKAFADAGEGYQVIDRSGKPLFAEVFQNARPYQEGLAAVSKDGKWGFINENGTLVIPFKYNYASSFQEGIAVVESGEGLGYISKDGKELVPPSALVILPFKNNHGWVLRSGMWYKTNRQGQFVDSIAVNSNKDKFPKDWGTMMKDQITLKNNVIKFSENDTYLTGNKEPGELIPERWARDIWYFVDEKGNRFYEEE